jgi:putative oxidoreductase
MLAAFAIAHLPRGGWPIQNAGELPLLYALVFLFLAAAGAGPVSVDEASWRADRSERLSGR